METHHELRDASARMHLSGIIGIHCDDGSFVPLPPMLAWLAVIVYSSDDRSIRVDLAIELLWGPHRPVQRRRHALNQLVHRLNRLGGATKVIERSFDHLRAVLPLASALQRVPTGAPTPAAERWAEHRLGRSIASTAEKGGTGIRSAESRDAESHPAESHGATTEHGATVGTIREHMHRLSPPSYGAPQLWAVPDSLGDHVMSFSADDWTRLAVLRAYQGSYAAAHSLMQRAARVHQREGRTTSDPLVRYTIHTLRVALEVCLGRCTVRSAEARLAVIERQLTAAGRQGAALRVRLVLLALLERCGSYERIAPAVPEPAGYNRRGAAAGLLISLINWRYGQYLAREPSARAMRTVAATAACLRGRGTGDLVEAGILVLARHGCLRSPSGQALVRQAGLIPEAGRNLEPVVRTAIQIGGWYQRIESWHEAAEQMARALRVANVSQDPLLLARAHAALAELLYRTTRWRDAERAVGRSVAALSEARRAARCSGLGREVGTRLTSLDGLLALERGAMGHARDCFEQLQESSWPYHDPTLAGLFRARFLVRRQRGPEAVEVLSATLDHVRGRFVPAQIELASELAHIARRTGAAMPRDKISAARYAAAGCGMHVHARRLSLLSRPNSP